MGKNMNFEKLNVENVENYLEYLKIAMTQEPDMMTAEEVDENGIRERIADEFYQRTTSILAFDGSKVVGRIEFHFYGCMQDGYRMAYVDWIYVLKDFRHRGIAQALFQEFEKECEKHQIHQYYLITAENAEASRFYRAFPGVDIKPTPILRKYFEQ